MVRKSSGPAIDYVEVEWQDIISTAGWERYEDTKDEKDEWFGFTVIPPGCVKKISPLIKGGNRDSIKKKNYKTS